MLLSYTSVFVIRLDCHNIFEWKFFKLFLAYRRLFTVSMKYIAQAEASLTVKEQILNQNSNCFEKDVTNFNLVY